MGNRIKVEATVNTYPESTDSATNKDEKVTVKSHWLYSDRVQITFRNQEMVVVGDDLIQAIRNCMNCD